MRWRLGLSWPIASLLLAAALTSAAQQPAQQSNAPAKAPAPASSQDRVVITGMVPIPDVGPGAARYTSADVEKIEQQALDAAFRADSEGRHCIDISKGPQARTAAFSAKTANDGGTLMCGNKTLVGVLGCEREYATNAANLASKAAAVTREAEAVRREAAAGRASASDVEAAELKRQDAVNKMQKARVKLEDARADVAVWQDAVLKNSDAPDLDAFAEGARRKQFENQIGMIPGLRIEGVRASQQDSKKGPLVVVQGKVANTGVKPARVSGLVAMLLDERNWVVARQAVVPDKRFVVAGGEAKPFSVVVDFAPQATMRAVVVFAHETEPPPRTSVAAVCTKAFSDAEYQTNALAGG